MAIPKESVQLLNAVYDQMGIGADKAQKIKTDVLGSIIVSYKKLPGHKDDSDKKAIQGFSEALVWVNRGKETQYDTNKIKQMGEAITKDRSWSSLPHGVRSNVRIALAEATSGKPGTPSSFWAQLKIVVGEFMTSVRRTVGFLQKAEEKGKTSESFLVELLKAEGDVATILSEAAPKHDKTALLDILTSIEKRLSPTSPDKEPVQALVGAIMGDDIKKAREALDKIFEEKGAIAKGQGKGQGMAQVQPQIGTHRPSRPEPSLPLHAKEKEKGGGIVQERVRESLPKSRAEEISPEGSPQTATSEATERAENIESIKKDLGTLGLSQASSLPAKAFTPNVISNLEQLVDRFEEIDECIDEMVAEGGEKYQKALSDAKVCLNEMKGYLGAAIPDMESQGVDTDVIERFRKEVTEQIKVKEKELEDAIVETPPVKREEAFKDQGIDAMLSSWGVPGTVEFDKGMRRNCKQIYYRIEGIKEDLADKERYMAGLKGKIEDGFRNEDYTKVQRNLERYIALSDHMVRNFLKAQTHAEKFLQKLTSFGVGPEIKGKIKAFLDQIDKNIQTVEQDIETIGKKMPQEKAPAPARVSSPAPSEEHEVGEEEEVEEEKAPESYADVKVSEEMKAAYPERLRTKQDWAQAKEKVGKYITSNKDSVADCVRFVGYIFEQAQVRMSSKKEALARFAAEKLCSSVNYADDQDVMKYFEEKLSRKDLKRGWQHDAWESLQQKTD